MANTITNPEGKITGIIPTLYDGGHEAARREVAAVNKAADKFDREYLKRQAAIQAARPTEEERRRAIVEGLRRMVKKIKRDGDAKRAQKIGEHAAAAEKHLGEFEDIDRKVKAKGADHLGEAVEAAAKELHEKLPLAFPSVEDAALFARTKLPLSNAVAESVKAANERAKLSRDATLKLRDYWAEIAEGGRRAFNSLYDDANARHLAEIGE